MPDDHRAAAAQPAAPVDPAEEAGAPSVSVLVASYNHARFITQAIESVWAQQGARVELIVIDDGSSDNSVAILRELQARSPIPMSVAVQENAGVSATFNRALALARGDWVCILASDDYYAPDFLARSLAAASGLAENGVVHANAYLVEADGTLRGTMDEVAQLAPLRGQAFEQMVTGQGRMTPCTMVMRRRLLLEAGGFDPQLAAEDTDLFLRLARIAEFHYIEEPIFYSRYTPGSLGKRPWVWGDSTIRAIQKHADILGPRLQPLLSKVAANLCDHCFEYGEWGHGLRWCGRAIGFAPGAAAKATVAGHLGYRIGRAAARNLAYRLFGRERLVRWKRALRPSATDS